MGSQPLFASRLLAIFSILCCTVTCSLPSCRLGFYFLFTISNQILIRICRSGHLGNDKKQNSTRPTKTQTTHDIGLQGVYRLLVTHGISGLSHWKPLWLSNVYRFKQAKQNKSNANTRNQPTEKTTAGLNRVKSSLRRIITVCPKIITFPR